MNSALTLQLLKLVTLVKYALKMKTKARSDRLVNLFTNSPIKMYILSRMEEAEIHTDLNVKQKIRRK